MKVISVLSGGLDSTVLTARLALERDKEVIAITVFYGQRHKREIAAAIDVTKRLKIRHEIVDLSGLAGIMKGSSQTDPSIPVPHGHYAAENMKLTVVPNRNMILLAVAGALAISEKAMGIFYAAHAGDHAIYPDCREEFVAPLSQALWAADWHHVRIERPFIGITKREIVEHGAAILAHDVMALSYSCYQGGELHCALCGTCQERRAAFRDAGVIDPTVYEPTGMVTLPDSDLKS